MHISGCGGVEREAVDCGVGHVVVVGCGVGPCFARPGSVSHRAPPSGALGWAVLVLAAAVGPAEA